MRYTKLIVLILAVILCVGLLAGAIIRNNNATPAVKHTAKETGSTVEGGSSSVETVVHKQCQILVSEEFLESWDISVVEDGEEVSYDLFSTDPHPGAKPGGGDPDLVYKEYHRFFVSPGASISISVAQAKKSMETKGGNVASTLFVYDIAHYYEYAGEVLLDGMNFEDDCSSISVSSYDFLIVLE